MWNCFKTFAFIALLGGPALADAQATDILRKVDGMNRGQDLVRDLSMQLIDRSGNVQNRTGRIYRREAGSGTYEQITVFFSPQNIRNTSFLSIDQAGSDDPMWLYLPALRRAKLVPSADRGSSFVGIDFSMEDVKLGFEYEDYDASVLKMTKVGGQNAAVLQVTPRTATLQRSLGYETAVITVRLDNYYMVDSQYYQRGKLIKHNSASKIRKVGGIWTAMELTSHDLQNNHKTVLQLRNVRYNSGLPASFFSRQTLTREVYQRCLPAHAFCGSVSAWC